MSRVSKTVQEARKLHLSRTEVVDPKPLCVPIQLPTMEQQIRQFTRLGAAARLGLLEDSDLPIDDFQDHLDDLPREGLSPHEEPLWKQEGREIVNALIKKSKKKSKDAVPADKKPVDSVPAKPKDE